MLNPDRLPRGGTLALHVTFHRTVRPAKVDTRARKAAKAGTVPGLLLTVDHRGHFITSPGAKEPTAYSYAIGYKLVKDTKQARRVLARLLRDLLGVGAFRIVKRARIYYREVLDL